MAAKTLLVFLHGSGDTGLGFRSFLHNVALPNYEYNSFANVLHSKNVDILTPSARHQYYSATGSKLNVWFDRDANFLKDGLDSAEDLYGADRSLAEVP